MNSKIDKNKIDTSIKKTDKALVEKVEPMTLEMLAEIMLKSFSELYREITAIKTELKDLKNEMYAFKDEMHTFKKEMYAFRDEMYAFKNEMYAFRDEMYAFQKEMYSFRDEMYAFQKEMHDFKKQTDANFKNIYNDRVTKDDIRGILNCLSSKVDKEDMLNFKFSLLS